MENIDFNDERLNYKIGFAKKYCLWLIGIASFLYTVIKAVGRFYSIKAPFFLEAVLIILPVLTLILEKVLIKSDVKDEMYLNEVSKYYNRAFKLFAIIFLSAYALYMPYVLVKGIAVFSGVSLMNFCLFLFIFFMFLYLRYQNSFLNYNIIEEEDKTFYKNVFKNILKIAAVLCVMFLASFFVGVIIAAVNNYSIKSFLLSAVLVYIVSFFSNSIYYILFSVFEKISYNADKNNTAKKVSSPTLIICIIALVFGFGLGVWSSLLSMFNEEIIAMLKLPGETLGQTTVRISLIQRYLGDIRFVFYTLGIVCLYFDVRKNIKDEKALKLLKIIFFVNITLQFADGFKVYCNSDLSFLLSQYLSVLDIDSMSFYTLIRSYCVEAASFITTMFNLIMLLKLSAIYKRYKNNILVILITFCAVSFVRILSIIGLLEPEVYGFSSIIYNVIYLVFVFLMLFKKEGQKNAE